MSDIVGDAVTWTTTLESYFVSVGEKSAGRAWLHEQSAHLYNWRKTFIEIPVIVGSGITGFLNGASNSLFEDAKVSSVALGCASLAIGLLGTLNSYFGWAKRAEGHRIGALQYQRLNHFISVEMGLPREERMRPGELLKLVKESIDRLAETCPMIPPVIVQRFRVRFGEAKYADLAKPDETNGLNRIRVYVAEAGDRRSVPPTPIAS